MNVLLINLEHRTDRLKHATNEFDKLQIKFEIFDAIEHSFGAYGCTLSHISCLKIAKENNFPCVMICEDDIDFFIDSNEFNEMINSFIKDDDLAIMPIISHTPKKECIFKYNEIFNVSTDIQTATCYVVKNIYYDKLINIFEISKNNLLKTKNIELFSIDVVWKQLQKKDIWVVPNKICGRQYPGYSDILGKYCDYGNLFTNNKYCIIQLMGGLGNRLFQISTAFEISKKQCRKLMIYNKQDNYHSEDNYEKNFFRKLEKYENNIPFESITFFNEKTNTALLYNEDIPDPINHLFLKGYFQNERYFIESKKDILELFDIEKERKDFLENKYENLSNSVFIHVRRGDYLQISVHNVNLENYYRKCIKKVLENHSNCMFYIFSDDIEYCKNNDLFKNINSFFVENENEVNSIYLMSMCNVGGICANSSFSWWGSYLNKNPEKDIYFPNKWFGDTTTEIVQEIGFKNSFVVNVE